MLSRTARGLVAIGRLDAPQDAPALEKLLQKLDWPVFCDIASSTKGRIPPDRQVFALDHPEALRLIRAYAPETILQFGSGFVSKHYYATLLPQSKAAVIQVSPRSGLRDPAHCVSLRIQSRVHAFIEGLNFQDIAPSDPAARLQLFNEMDVLREALNRRIPAETLSFPRIAADLLARVPDGEGLFLGNSLVIRSFDTICSPFPQKIRIISNRGVSGIEGNIATSVGFAEASGQRVTAVIGDISFLHDLNSLMLLAQSATPVILIVINNGGGRIFDRLPIRDFPEIIDPYMTTPHGMTFGPLAAQFGLPYFQAGAPGKLREAYEQALQLGQSAVIEVMLSGEEDLRTFQAMQAVRLS